MEPPGPDPHCIGDASPRSRNHRALGSRAVRSTRQIVGWGGQGCAPNRARSATFAAAHPVQPPAAMKRITFASLGLALIACGGSGGSPGDPDGAPPVPDADPSGYREIISEDWTLASGTEEFHCIRLTTPTDLWIHGIRPIAPLGTHHTLL